MGSFHHDRWDGRCCVHIRSLEHWWLWFHRHCRVAESHTHLPDMDRVARNMLRMENGRERRRVKHNSLHSHYHIPGNRIHDYDDDERRSHSRNRHLHIERSFCVQLEHPHQAQQLWRWRPLPKLRFSANFLTSFNPSATRQATRNPCWPTPERSLADTCQPTERPFNKNSPIHSFVSKALNALSECEDSVQHEKLCISNLSGSKAIANRFSPATNAIT